MCAEALGGVPTCHPSTSQPSPRSTHVISLHAAVRPDHLFLPFALQADGSPLFSTAAEGAAPVEDGFGSEREVGGAREQAPQEEASFVHRLRTAAGQAAAKAGQAAVRLRAFTMRLATMVAKSIVLGVAAQLAHRQRLARLAAEQRERAHAKLAAAAAARQAAQERLRAVLATRSKADRAFVKMLLSQDNPARTLEDKWDDLCHAMRSDRAPELRCRALFTDPFNCSVSLLLGAVAAAAVSHATSGLALQVEVVGVIRVLTARVLLRICRKRTAQLFSAALDSSHAVQQAIATEAAKGSKALDRLVSQHGCVEHEEALRAEIFAEILAGS